MNVSRTRTLDAPVEQVWSLVADPHRLPAWWPLVERVEGVDEDEWTTVLRSRRGKAVRADYRLELSDAAARRRAWTQRLPGSPFERLLWESRTEVSLAPAGDGTAVTLSLRQRPRGWSKLAGFLMRRAARAQLDEALGGLAQVAE